MPTATSGASALIWAVTGASGLSLPVRSPNWPPPLNSPCSQKVQPFCCGFQHASFPLSPFFLQTQPHWAYHLPDTLCSPVTWLYFSSHLYLENSYVFFNTQFKRPFLYEVLLNLIPHQGILQLTLPSKP